MVQRVLTGANNNETLVAHSGDEVLIELSEKAASGYAWAVSTCPPQITVSVERPPVSHDAAIGSDARTIFRVVVREPVLADLVLLHRQPWDPGGDAQAFRLRIDARSPRPVE